MTVTAWKTLDTHNSSLTIDLSKEEDMDDSWDTTRRIQLWDQNRSFIDLISRSKEEKYDGMNWKLDSDPAG
jgi:hypothetical protein